MARMIHSMIRVRNEEKSCAFYNSAFGMTTSYRLGFPDFTLVYLRTPENDFELELTINHGRTEPYNLGDGYGHIALNVADLEAEHHRMKSAGLAPKDIKQFDKDGIKIAKFFFIEDPDGYKIEVLERSGHFA